MRGKLTKRSVDALKSDVRDQFIWDTEIPGFGCKVTPKGARIYILQHAWLGRDHRVTIGRHGSDVTAEQARLEALRLRGIVAAGENPATVSTRGQSASTIADLGERYMIEYAKEHKKPSAVAQDRRNLDNQRDLPLIKIGDLPSRIFSMSPVLCETSRRERRKRTRRRSCEDAVSFEAVKLSPIAFRRCCPRCSSWPRNGRFARKAQTRAAD